MSKPANPMFRPEVQGLRALAVLGVVLFHLWPLRLTGGYVGVDVFFVISGFLISEHLIREQQANGRIVLSSFYARRIRRLLPAALLVLAITAIGVVLLSPRSEIRGFLTEVAASALYVENWLLAFESVDYFAAESAASPVQHYWSLSVEEQFYLVWPLIVVGAFWVGQRRRHDGRPVVAAAFLLLFVLALAYSIVVTHASPSFAYFATPAHAWEFAAGGLLALTSKRLESAGWIARHRLRAAMSWAGLVAIAGSMLFFDGATPFPGALALVPVLGTIAVIAAGTPDVAWSPTRALSARPIQFVGDVSYALYLWHWPLIVLAPALLVRELGTVDKVIILGATVVLAWLTRNHVELPIIRSRSLRGRRYSFGFAALGSASVIVLCAVPIQDLDRQAREIAATLEAHMQSADGCFGAVALDESDSACGHRLEVDPAFDFEVETREAAYTSIASASLGRALSDDPCSVGPFGSRECTWGSSDAEHVIVLVGDSHAEQLSPALAYQTESHDWQVRSITKRSCPMVVEEWVASEAVDYSQNEQSCRQWREETIERLGQDPDIDAIVAASFTHRIGRDGAESDVSDMAEALSRTWARLGESGAAVVVAADTPLSAVALPATCLAHAVQDEECSAARADALPADPARRSVAADQAGTSLLDLTDAFCDDTRCFGAIGGLRVYDDEHHLTPAFALSLAPLITASLEGAIAPADGG